jgi:hypothetical protein
MLFAQHSLFASAVAKYVYTISRRAVYTGDQKERKQGRGDDVVVDDDVDDYMK